MDLVDVIGRGDPIRSIETGTVTGAIVNNIATVNCRGNDEKVRVVLDLSIHPGDVVLMVRGEGKPWAIAKLSESFQNPSTGTVGTVVGGSNTIPVTYTWLGKSYVLNMPFLSSYSPVNGDTVQLIWRPDRTGGYVAGKLGTSAIAPPVPPLPTPTDDNELPTGPPTTPISATEYFVAYQSGSYRAGEWRTDTDAVVQYDWGGYGDNNGAWFYGTTIRELLSGATCNALTIKVQRLSGGDRGPQTVHFYFHTSDVMPDTTTNVTYTLGPTNGTLDIDEVAEFSLPAAWGQTLIDTGGGIGIQTSPYVVLAGLSEMPDSGSLSIDWQV